MFYKLYFWLRSWCRLLYLNWPYFCARLQGYSYYIEVGIDIQPRRTGGVTGKEVREDLKEIGADVLVVRRVWRRSVRSSLWRMYAVFRDKDSAMLYKLREGGGGVRRFKWYEF